ncbi:MAG: serine protease [Rhodoplanes sp.]|uniref:S1C family serine protease n=1 Tax=Rhodoplanes sp. TaxID=1968906 RepID=UPI0017C39BF7|nr:S1C family serine protease [Rhodoplanes sp.]NVO17856.1 serine protease [Rhodoplanes sp.]
MRIAPLQDRSIAMALRALVACALLCAAATAAAAQRASLDETLAAVVKVKTFINPDGRTVSSLGREREGAGVVIDASGLIVTIGYLMVEAHAVEVTTRDGKTLPADVVGYDHETGFGLLRTVTPPGLKPMPLGHSSDLKVDDPVLVAGHGGASGVTAARVVAKREFAGSWEYLLDEAIFTAPPNPAWSGAALVTRDGKLAGIGSLIVGDAKGDGTPSPGNMFVPVDRLAPVMADLIADGRIAGPGRPWLGVAAEDMLGRLVVTRVTPDSPAARAGLRRGDVIEGVAGTTTDGLAVLYRKMWALGAAGVTVPLDVRRDGTTRRLDVQSIDRLDHLKLKSTF